MSGPELDTVEVEVDAAEPVPVEIVVDIVSYDPIVEVDAGPCEPVDIDLAASTYTIIIHDGGTAGYVHHQAVASLLWVINHNLNRRVDVEVTDLGGSVMIAEITAPTLNQTRVAFVTPHTGYAIIN